MTDGFIAMRDGQRVLEPSTASLGVVPMVTSRWLRFEDMDWSDVMRVSNRAVDREPGLYVPRLGESKTVGMKDGGIVRARFVGIMRTKDASGRTLGFTFQLTDGLSPVPMSDSMVDDVLDLLPDDLTGCLAKTAKGRLWLPKAKNVLGTTPTSWYGWYQYHNTDEDRRVRGASGDFHGWWTDSTSRGQRVIVDADGRRAVVDGGEYLPCVCFSMARP